MNERDSETIAGLLSKMGYSVTAERKEADVAVINTCSVREHADKRFFGTLGQLKKIKEARPDFVVCVCGCMMQQRHITDVIKTKYPWVDVIFGTHNIHELPVLLEEVEKEKENRTLFKKNGIMERGKGLISVWENGEGIVEDLPSSRLYRHKAFVNIMYGCNNFCTYCIVPYTRGRERSRKPADILNEVKKLAADGVKEITLLGQNVNSYKGITGPADVSHGETNNGKKQTDFADLIYMLQETEGIERIRFMTSHPKDLSDKLIDAYKNCSKLCSAIHLPMQSGSNSILERMNRKYTKEQYMDLVAKLRYASPGICITTDIIVGFPGETEQDFQETLDVIKKVCFDSAFTFIYSMRKGTPAEKYEDQIPQDIKHERFRRLVAAVNECSSIKNAAYEGRKEMVLVDGHGKKDTGKLAGRTEGYKLVDFEGPLSLQGEFVYVNITKGNTFSLTGELDISHV